MAGEREARRRVPAPAAAAPPAGASANRPVVVFAHGAGAGWSSPWMRAWSDRLSAAVGPVAPVRYPFGEARKPAPRAETLVPCHSDVVAAASAGAAAAGARVVLVGKSLGSRVGLHALADGALPPPGAVGTVAAAVCFGYPLIGANGSDRSAVLARLPPTVPVLFIAGDRDAMCPPAAMRAAVARSALHPASAVEVVPGGDHSLVVARSVLKAAGTTQADVDARLCAVVADFVARAVAAPQRDGGRSAAAAGAVGGAAAAGAGGAAAPAPVVAKGAGRRRSSAGGDVGPPPGAAPGGPAPAGKRRAGGGAPGADPKRLKR
jgi:predicted alpha/beta-hydrolase family hydrolase